MGSNNSSEMNFGNNDEADSDELRNLIAQQTVVQMQELVDSLVFFKKYYNVNKTEKLNVFYISIE